MSHVCPKCGKVLSDAFPLDEHQRSVSCTARQNQQEMERLGWAPIGSRWGALLLEEEGFPIRKLKIPRSGLIQSWSCVVNGWDGLYHAQPRKPYCTSFFVPEWAATLIKALNEVTNRDPAFALIDGEPPKLSTKFCDELLIFVWKNPTAREHILGALRLSGIQEMLKLSYFKKK